MTETTTLVVIPAAQVSTIVAADTADILGKLAAKVAAHDADVSTSRGRREIASLAAEIASSKMDLIRLGKGLTEGWRKSTAAVNAECKVIEERMDALKVQIRAPLAEYEDRDRRRVWAHEHALAEMVDITDGCADLEIVAEQIAAAYGGLAAAHQARDWQEFSQRAERAYREGLGKLDSAAAYAKTRDANRAEAARLQTEREEHARQEAARIQAEREARIATDAAARARHQAEAEAERLRQAELQRVEAERRRVEAEARQAAEQAEAERQLELRARHDAEARAVKAEQERIAAEERAEADRIAAAEKAERDRIAAVQAEQDRVAAAARADLVAADRRAANTAHRGKINRAAADALALTGIAPDQAVAVVTAIARGEIPRITVSY